MICKAIGELKLVSYRMERDSKLLFYKKTTHYIMKKDNLEREHFV